jgi:hypothetical protein
MPVLPYHNQKEPAEDAVIWRFLNLRKFRDFMANEELYFCRADLFSDKTEGLPPEQYVRRILRLDPLDIHDQVKLNHHLGVLAQDREMFFISCWHLYRKEELELWEQYGPDGAAVCSRYGLLKAAMARLLDDAHSGSVQYGTDHLTDRFNILEFITTKQKKFETDCEVRAFLMAPNVLGGGNRHIGLDDFPHRLPLDMNPRHPWVPDGKRRRITLRDLVEDVVISPWAEPDEVEEIQLWTKLKTSGATRNSELRNKATPSLVEFRKYKGITEPTREKERVVSKEELERFYATLSTLKPSRVRFLYAQRWEVCRLNRGGLPTKADSQFLEVTLRLLKDWAEQGIDVWSDL